MPAEVTAPKKGIFSDKKKTGSTGRPSAVAAQPKEEKKLQTYKTKGQDKQPGEETKTSKVIDEAQDAPILGLDSNNNSNQTKVPLKTID